MRKAPSTVLSLRSSHQQADQEIGRRRDITNDLLKP
jgi:hypothetical protein